MSADEKKKAADIGEFLDVRNLTVQYTSMGSVIHAVNGISFRLNKGETLALVGETGAGKTSIAKAILRILPDVSAKSGGEVYFQGTDMMKLKEKEMQKIRGHKISMIFQDPMTSLNPVTRVGDQIAEVILLHNKISKAEARKRAMEMLEQVGIPGARCDDYPHQFSGGMKQRVMIAIALACSPELLIADEPTTALDVTIQAQIMELIRDLQKEIGMSVILITHDIGLVAQMADRVFVMYAGQIIEMASVKGLFYHPAHPYTKALLDTVPGIYDESGRTLASIPGIVPENYDQITGCRFADRCAFAGEGCEKKQEMREIEKDHFVRCHKADRS